ncbi:ammonium transporter, partial [Helicobacter rodentium]|uniref:ammonium transporter n=1 Tax=Helicobacter rodentium TaxID=59617 RepID=UPI003F4A799A
MKKVLLFLGLCNLVFGAESEISAVDTLFLIACSGLVLLMTPALGMFYGGMVHRGNVLSTTINCTILFALLCVQWVILGYTLAFGDDVGQVVGNLNHIFLINIQDSMVGLVSENLFAFFQMLFAVIGAAIITGSFVERMRFGVLLIFILCWSTLVYDILAHWVWG